MFLLKRFSTVMATPDAAAIQRHFSLLHRSEARRGDSRNGDERES